MKTKVMGGLFGLVSLFAAGLVNAATVSILPPTQSGTVGDPISLTVVGSGFGASGVTGGSIQITWDATILQLNTVLLDAQLDGLLVTGFSDVTRFDATTPGTLLFTALVGISAPPRGVNNVAFEFLHLHFTALAPPGTAANVGLGPDGNWQLGDFTSIVLAPSDYVGATVTIAAVPVPAAAWLFGSGVLGLVAVARRRSA